MTVAVVALSVHVVDIMRGRPLAGVQTSLHAEDGASLENRRTGEDGRIDGLGGAALPPGVYDLRVDLGELALREGWTLRSAIVRLDLTRPDRYHFPLLLGPGTVQLYRGVR